MLLLFMPSIEKINSWCYELRQDFSTVSIKINQGILSALHSKFESETSGLLSDEQVIVLACKESAIDYCKEQLIFEYSLPLKKWLIVGARHKKKFGSTKRNNYRGDKTHGGLGFGLQAYYNYVNGFKSKPIPLINSYVGSKIKRLIWS